MAFVRVISIVGTAVTAVLTVVKAAQDIHEKHPEAAQTASHVWQQYTERGPKASAHVVEALNASLPENRPKWTRTNLHDFLRSFIQIRPDGVDLIIAPHEVSDLLLAGLPVGAARDPLQSDIERELIDLRVSLHSARPESSTTSPTSKSWRRHIRILEEYGVSAANIRKLLGLQGVTPHNINKWTSRR